MMFTTIFKRRSSSFKENRHGGQPKKVSRRISESSINIQRVTGNFSDSPQSMLYENENSSRGHCNDDDDDDSFDGDISAPNGQQSLTVPPGQINRIARSAPSTPEDQRRSFNPRHVKSTGRLELQSIKHPSPLMSAKSEDIHSDNSPKFKSRNQKFHKLFKNVPRDEHVLNYYSCAYCSDILLQGYLYISKNWLCFYSKILAKETLIEIPIAKVLKITRERLAFIIPNAIGIHTADDKYVFGSLISRDSAYKLLTKVWRGSQVMSDDKPDSEEEFSFMGLDTERDNSAANNNKQSIRNRKHNVIDINANSTDTDSGSACEPCASDDKKDADTIKNKTLATEPSPAARNCTDTSRLPMFLIPLKCFCQKKLGPSLQKIWHMLQTAPTIYLLLAACLFMVAFLLLSALIMTSKLFYLQAQINQHSATSKAVHTSGKMQTSYSFKHDLHVSAIDRFHSVLQANIKVLDQVHHSLKSLHKNPVDDPKESSSS